MTAMGGDPGTPVVDRGGLFESIGRHPATVAVLHADPELASSLSSREIHLAAHAARARCVALAPGPWRPPADARAPGSIGLLLLDGLVCRSVTVGAERSCELLGDGDLLRPWAEDASHAIPSSLEWEVLAPTRVAVLDRAFAHAISRWPELYADLIERALRPARSQAVLVATSHIKRVDVRLLALFWHLAERWGRVTPTGIVVPVKLTHARLGSLVGAQRPSVTTALTRLTQRGILGRNEAGEFLLDHSAGDELGELCLSRDSRHLRLVRSMHRPVGAATPFAP